MPNAYTLLSLLPTEKQTYTILHLADAFFSISLAKQSQLLFDFEETDLGTGFNGQLTWTCLRQGFKNFLTFFDEALYIDLDEYHFSLAQVTLLQYVDDWLIAAGDTTCWEAIDTSMLNVL